MVKTVTQLIGLIKVPLAFWIFTMLLDIYGVLPQPYWMVALVSPKHERFKGVGMRWSEDGFNHLLYLRLEWVNQRSDSLFPHVSNGQIDPSHNR
jgi:hypothetical protein